MPPVSKDDLIDIRNKLIDMREQSMSSWSVDGQTDITIALAHAVMPISELLQKMGVDLIEINNARAKSASR